MEPKEQRERKKNDRVESGLSRGTEGTGKGMADACVEPTINASSSFGPRFLRSSTYRESAVAAAGATTAAAATRARPRSALFCSWTPGERTPRGL